MNRRQFLKKTLEGIVIGSIPLISKCSKNPVESPQELGYFPLQVGNSWTHKITENNKTRYETNNIIESKNIDGKTYYVFDKFLYFNNKYFRKDENNQIIGYNDGKEQIWYKFSPNKNESWLVSDKFDYQIQLIGEDRTISTPFGEFNNCLKFHFFEAFDVDFYHYLAPNIGIIKYEY